MPQPDRARSVARVLPLAALMLLASCSGPFQPKASAAKVDVDNLPTDILFGVPSPAPAAAAPGGAVASIPLPPQTLVLPDQPASQIFLGNDVPFATVAGPAACPTASPTTFPAEVATADVTKMPTEGAYRWATGGTFDKVVGTLTIPLPLPMFEQRVVRHPAVSADTVPQLPGQPADYTFKYQTIEPNVSDGTALLMYWQVKTNPVANDPEGGLVLQQVDAIDKAGKDAGPIYQGVTGLLLMPLPVQPGTAFSSTTADSKGTNSLKLKGTVGGRERVDACGEPIQAWGVDAQVQNAGTSAAAATAWHYDVATQKGALIVAFNIDGAFFGTKFNRETARIGQLKPDPVPDPYK